jgi:DivIVA domain-containing protein
MISASTAGTHRFGRVKRNGYDPAEVDAVVERLLDALSEYEEQTRDLGRKLDDSTVSASAIAMTLAAVERTKAEIVAEANAQAEAIMSEATTSAESIAGLAAGLGAEISAQRDAILSQAYHDADAIVARVESESAIQQVRSAAIATAVVTEAVRSAADIEQRSHLRDRSSAMVAAWRLRESHGNAEAAIERAETQAAMIVEQAEREGERLNDRVSDLRAAVSNLQASAVELARVTIVESDVIDLEAIEARDRSPSHRPVKLAPIPTDTHTAAVSDTGPATYYQRRAGGIKERIKIARSTP